MHNPLTVLRAASPIPNSHVALGEALLVGATCGLGMRSISEHPGRRARRRASEFPELGTPLQKWLIPLQTPHKPSDGGMLYRHFLPEMLRQPGL